jgi:hypothetical protein
VVGTVVGATVGCSVEGAEVGRRVGTSVGAIVGGAHNVEVVTGVQLHRIAPALYSVDVQGQPENALLPMLEIESVITTDARLAQFKKTWELMDVIESGIATYSRLKQPANA